MKASGISASAARAGGAGDGPRSRLAFLRAAWIWYKGSATEKGLELMVKALTPHPGGAGGPCGRRPADAGDGQRSDALGEYVQSDQGCGSTDRGLLPTHAEYQMMNRHNSFFLGTYGTGMEIGLQESVRPHLRRRRSRHGL